MPHKNFFGPREFWNAANLVTILTKEIRDALRNRWFILLSLIFLGLSSALSLLGFSGLGNFGIAGFGRTTASLLNGVLLIVPLMGLLLGALALAGEKDQGTLMTLLAQPVTPGEILFGKFLGIALALSGTVFLGFGLSGTIIAFSGGMDEWGAYLVFVGLTLLLGLVYLAFGFLLSVFSKKTATAAGLAIFFWFFFMFLSDLGLMGSAIVLKLEAPQLLSLSFLNPTQIFRIAVMCVLQGGLELLGPAGRYATELFGPSLTHFLSGLLFAWLVFPLSAALYFFKKGAAE